MTVPKPPAAGFVAFSQEEIGLKFDHVAQTLEIFGVKYALGIFAFLGRDPIGTTMTILERPGDGTVIIRDEGEVNHRRRVMRDLLREIGEALSVAEMTRSLPEVAYAGDSYDSAPKPIMEKSFDGKWIEFTEVHSRQLIRRIQQATE